MILLYTQYPVKNQQLGLLACATEPYLCPKAVVESSHFSNLSLELSIFSIATCLLFCSSMVKN
jgi:hypothetical protein